MKKLISILVLMMSFSVLVYAQCPTHVTEFEFDYSKPTCTNTIVGTLVACDPDAGQIITWSINDPSGFWSINNGNVRVGDALGLNASPNMQFTITVTATDNGNPSASSSSVITLNGLLSAPENQSFTIDENVPVGTVIGNVDVNGQDVNTLTFTIVSATNNGDGIFSVDGGIIKTIGLVDFEGTYNSYVLSIEIEDSNNVGVIVTTDITITVNDINEAPSISQ